MALLFQLHQNYLVITYKSCVVKCGSKKENWRFRGALNPHSLAPHLISFHLLSFPFHPPSCVQSNHGRRVQERVRLPAVWASQP